MGTNLLACGHEPSPHGDSTTGTGHVDGVEICWACCDLLARIDLRRAHDRHEPFQAYLSGAQVSGAGNGRVRAGAPTQVTTWSGGVLGTVTKATYVRLARPSPFHGDCMWAVQVLDVHGHWWHGRGSAGMVVTLYPARKYYGAKVRQESAHV